MAVVVGTTHAWYPWAPLSARGNPRAEGLAMFSAVRSTRRDALRRPLDPGACPHPGCGRPMHQVYSCPDCGAAFGDDRAAAFEHDCRRPDDLDLDG